MTDFSELHDELRALAADVLARSGDRALPNGVLVQAGWTGLEVSEELGGAGASFAETAVVCTELGRAAADSRHFGTALGVGLLNMLAANDFRDSLLSGAASGETRLAVALPGDAIGSRPFTLDADQLRGDAGFVLDAVDAHWILVPTSTGAVAMAVDGLVLTEQPVLDETRRLATISVDAVVDSDRMLRGDAGALFDRAATMVACDSLGLSEAMLAATVDYTRVREQFGRPIGSFQAIKHACADMQVQIEISRQLVAAAVGAVATGSPDAAVAALRAKAYTGAAAVQIAGKAMQLHGGIGYTWESGIHAYLKRATLNRALFGSPAQLRHRLWELLRRAEDGHR